MNIFVYLFFTFVLAESAKCLRLIVSTFLEVDFVAKANQTSPAIVLNVIEEGWDAKLSSKE